MRNLFVTLLLVIPFFGSSQDGSFAFGARNAGLAGASVCISDPYSLFNNPAGLGKLDEHILFVGYQHRYNISEFQVIGGGGIYHHSLGNLGLGYYKFGDDLFSQQKLHVALGHTIQMISLGIGLDWVQYHIESVGTQQVLALQFGGIAEVTPQFRFGAHIFNINQSTLISDTGEQLPTVMKAGLSYLPTEELILSVEVEKDLGFDEVFKAGLEYQIISTVYLRTGIRTAPYSGAFGIGFHPKRMGLDYAFTNDSQLGNSHELSLSYSFIK